jgi:hypothetical protein
LDYWAAKYVLYPIDSNPRHHPDFPGIAQWLTSARDIINLRGGLYKPESGILIGSVTKNEGEMVAYSINLGDTTPPVAPKNLRIIAGQSARRFGMRH